MNETVWEKIYRVLKKNSVDVYAPASKVGECKKRYAVLKNDGTSQIGSLSSQVVYYTIMLYVPKNEYSSLERFKSEVADIVDRELFPLLMSTGAENPDFYDDTVKAHMATLTYKVNKRNKHL